LVLLVVLFVVVVTLVILFPVFAPAREGRGPRRSGINVFKQVGLALLLYAEDHGRLPPRDSWMDDTLVYSKQEDLYIVDPQSRFGWYGMAMNSTLSSKRADEGSEVAATVDKMEVKYWPDPYPLVYDSINYARNASDPFLSLPPQGRWRGGNIVCDLDGSAHFVKVEDTAKRYPNHFRGFSPLGGKADSRN
ncbi:MAG TPA: hypothetical protein VEX38_10215, partial [Fimbriimonadaceae bacterium]|nr:hypothetical protein [Fimbriimonadaceae bacterium]